MSSPGELTAPSEQDILGHTDSERILGFSLLLSGIFSEYCGFIGCSRVNPVNLDSAYEAETAKIRKKNEEEERRYQALLEVTQSISQQGGITRENYEKHKAVINGFVRNWLDIRGVSGGYNGPSEDIIAQEATPEVLEKYPSDGVYENVNIFDHNRHKMTIPGYDPDDESIYLHYEEGIMWQREYSGDGKTLTKFRIFHQSHRNTLKVLTVDVPELQRRIAEYVRDFNDQPLPLKPDLGMTADEYRGLIQEFNSRYSNLMSVVLGRGEDYDNCYYVYPEEELEDASDVQPFLVVNAGYKEIGKIFAQALNNPTVRDHDVTIIEMKREGDIGYDRITVIYPYQEPSQEKSVVAVCPESFAQLQACLTGYFRIKSGTKPTDEMTGTYRPPS